MNIEGQSIIVTGAGSGLGEGVARHFASLGGKVAVLDVNADGARRAASKQRSSASRAIRRPGS